MILEAEAPAFPIGGQRPHRSGLLLDLGFTAGAALLSTVLGLLALRISPRDLGERWTFGGSDQVLHYAIFSSAREVFPFLPNGRLGFPATQNLFFAPLFDPWSAIFVAVVGPFTPDGIWLFNVYNVAGFTAVGATAYVFFRALRLRRATSLVLGTLTAVLPYHFVQMSAGHPFLASYWAVPLIGLLLLVIGGEGTDPLARWTAPITDPRRRRLVRAAIVVVVAAAVAWTQSYYFVFGAILLGSAWALAVITALLRRAAPRTLAWPTLALGSLLGLIALQLGVLSNNQGDRYEKYFQGRLPQESESYGGKLQSLLLPSPTSGFDALAELAKGYARTSGILQTSENPSTAVVVSAAILLVLLILLLTVGQSGRLGTRTQFAQLIADARVGLLCQAFVVALLFFVVAGFGAILAYVVSPEIRAWSRMSIVLSVLALGVAGVAIEWAAPRRRILFPVLAALTMVGLMDQLGGTAAAIPLRPTDDASIRAFTRHTEQRLAEGCGIVQLPLKDFPETRAIGNMGDYDEALPYLFSSHESGLRYSYGAVQGTHSADAWNDATTPGAFEREYEASGACAILVDTFAYVDRPGDWKPFVNTVADADQPDVTSTDQEGRWLLFATGS